MAGMFSNALRSFNSNINSNYKVSDHPSSFAGPWKIFDAKHKSSGKAVSIFVFDKKSLEPHSSGSSFGSRSGGGSVKRAQDEVVERLRREASSLARLRHPSILELAEPVEDTRSGGLQFATEPVTGSLASLLVNERDAIDELDIQKGLLQLGKGLEFLHESAGLVHANFTPEAVVINAKSDWKITGLGFSGKAANTSVATSAPDIMLSEILNFDSRLPRSVQLDLDYTSPDFVMDGNATPAADMFSLGLLIVALYNSGKSPLEAHSSISSYKRLFSSSSTVPNANNNFMSKTQLGRSLSDVLGRLITRRPAQRLDAKEFQQAEYFDNILVSTIRFLESLPAKSQNEKSQFLRGLPRIMPQFSSKVLEKKVLPALLEEMKDRELLSLILQNIFKMLKNLPSAKRTFPEKVIPKLREVFIAAPAGKGTVAPERDSAKEAGLMVLLENIQLMANNTTGKEFKDDILPIIHYALESPTHSLVDAALQTLPVILATLDFSTIKNEVFPVIATVFSKTSSLGIKIRGLEALKALCGGGLDSDDIGDGLTGLSETKKSKPSSAILDKYSIQERVVPLLKAIKTKEPAVMMAALDVFKEIGKIADTDFLAIEALPILWNFSLGPLLNLQQFQAFMALIRSLSTRIEQEHTRKLQELSSSTTPVASRNDLMSFGGLGRTNGIDDTNGDTLDFEALVLGNKKASSPTVDAFDPWGSKSEPSVMPPTHSHKSSATAAPAAPTFSWSTPVQENTRPLGNSSSSGTIGGFGVLQPTSASSSTSAFSQPLQPSKPTLQSNQSNSLSKPVNWSTAASSNTWSTTSNSTSANAWSVSSNSSSAANPWTTSPSIYPPTSNTWVSNTTTTPQYNLNPQVRLNNAPLSQSSFSISPSPSSSSSPFTSFSIAPPPLSNTQNKNTNSFGSISGNLANLQSTKQASSNQKAGLDKYESLL